MKKIIILFLTLTFSLTATYSQKGKVNTALTYINTEDFEKALSMIELAEKHPKTMNWERTYYAKGKAYLKLYMSDKKELKAKYENLLSIAYDNYKKAFEIDSLKKLQNGLNLDIHDLYSNSFNAGIQMYNENNYTEAIIFWEIAISSRQFSTIFTTSIDTGLIFNLGIAAMNAEQIEKAVECFNTAAEHNYGDANTFVLLKNAYIMQSDSANALASLQQGFEKFPQDNAILIELVNYYLMSGASEQALQYLKLAKEQEPNNPTFYHAEGVLFDKIGEFDKSINSYKQALEINPDYFDSQYNLGVIYFNKGVALSEEANMEKDDKKYASKKKEADNIFKTTIPYFEKCIEIRPGELGTMENLKILYYRVGLNDKHNAIKVEIEALKASQ